MDFTQPKLKVHLMGPRHLCPTYWTRRFQCLSGRDPFNQNFRKFRSKTQWIGSVQPEKFGKNGSTLKGGPIFPVGPVGILVEWIAPSVLFLPAFLPCYSKCFFRHMQIETRYLVFSSYSVIIVGLSSSFCCFSLNSWDSMSFHFISSDQSSFLLSRPSYV